MLPPSRTVKAGKVAKFVVIVGNDSMLPASVVVRFDSTNPAVPDPEPVTVPVDGKKSVRHKAKTGRQTVEVNVPADATGSTVITASVGILGDTSTLKIKTPKAAR